MNTTTQTAFIGWARPAGKKWFQVCTAPSESQAWDQLLPALVTSGEAMVLPDGRRPDQPKNLQRERTLFPS